MTDSFIIETTGLQKSYEGTPALRGLDLQVSTGSITGFLGPNGAGKTTTIKTLLGMVRPTAGSARVFGLAAEDPKASVEIRQRTGFVSETKSLYDSMTVSEMIRFTAHFFPKWRTDLEQRYLRLFELQPRKSIKVLSQGTRTKLALLLAFARGADLLILDEPTSGLDPVMAEQVLQSLVAQVAEAGTTVFFSSHTLAEVDQIADHIAILHHGKSALAGSLDDLRERFRRIQFAFEGQAPDPAFRSPGIVRVTRDGRLLSVLVNGSTERVIAEAQPLRPSSVNVVSVPLKEMFLETVAWED